MKFILKVIEGFGYWMFMVIILSCFGALCTMSYQWFGQIVIAGRNFQELLFREGLCIPFLWPFSSLAAIGWVFQFHTKIFMAFVMVLSAIAIICDRGELGKE